MKLHDYISFFLVEETTGFLFQWFLHLCMRRPLEAAWNLGNTWTEIDPDASAAFKAEVPNYLPIGPLLPDAIFRSSSSDNSGDGLASSLSGAAPSIWAEDGFSNSWLSAHPPGSVLYIAYGSLTNVSEAELGNLIQGVQGSGVPFLWAVRPDQGGAPLTALRAELNPETASPELLQHSRVIPWAPQLEVLNHPSVGAFLSHCGWNSILESVTAGVPILARAGGFAEQRMNAHYVAEVWKVGVRIEEGAGEEEVARLVKEVMRQDADVRRRCEDLRSSAMAAAGGPSGSSSRNYGVFVEDMRRRAAAAAAAAATAAMA